METVTAAQNFNRVFAPVFTTGKRYIDLWGGRARGASHFGTDYFLLLLISDGYFRGCFMREIFSDIRNSLWADFKDRVADAVESGLVREKDIRLQEGSMTAYYVPNGNYIVSKGFKKANTKQTAKLKSLAGMTHILIEECEEVGFQDFQKLDDSLRTTKAQIRILRLFNPPHKNHWLIRSSYNLLPSAVPGKSGLWTTCCPSTARTSTISRTSTNRRRTTTAPMATRLPRCTTPTSTTAMCAD